MGGADNQGLDPSVNVRANAIRAGLDVFDDHPLGVGSAQYAAYDPSTPHHTRCS